MRKVVIDPSGTGRALAELMVSYADIFFFLGNPGRLIRRLRAREI